MGIPQPDKPETSENAISEGQDRPQRTSLESPKVAQPSCLRGGFIRLFLKRTEQDMSPEDASSSNQSAEDKHGVRGKKRKVLGANIFRLPCLRPAERTDAGEQIAAQVNKTDEQGNQATPEEELKPYSKASFLRKIRGYRLMRERDTTEKEKVIEMEQCKEGSAVEEHQEKKLELDRKVTQPRRYEEILGEKEKGSEEKENTENMHGEKCINVQEPESKLELSIEQDDSYKELENNDKNFRYPGKTMEERDDYGMDTRVKRIEMSEYKNPAFNMEELENELQEFENFTGRVCGQKEEDILGHDSHEKKVEDLGNKVTKHDKQTEDLSDLGNNVTNQEINSQRVHELENDSPEQNHLMHTTKAGDVTNDLAGNESIIEKAETLASNSQEQESPEENTGGIAKSSPKQDNNNKRVVRTKFSDQKEDGEVIQVATDLEVQTKEQLVTKLPENKSQEENLGKSENSLQDKDSHKENEDHLLEHKTQAEDVEKLGNSSQKKNILTEAMENSVDSQIQREEQPVDQFHDQDSHIQKEESTGDHLLKRDSHIQKEGSAGDPLLEQASQKQKGKAEDQLLEKESHIHKEKTEQCSSIQVIHTQHVGEVRSNLLGQHHNIEIMGGPEASRLDQERLPSGKTKAQILEQGSLTNEGVAHLLEDENCVKKDKDLGNIFSEVKGEMLTTARSEEPQAESSTFQESAPNTVDFNYYHHKDSQEAINDDDNIMEDTEWRSLQVEVKGMVQWLVEEASDRLTCFTQETQGTE